MAAKHKNKAIHAAIKEALDAGWTLDEKRGHWGRLRCPHHQRGGCIISVYGTPRNPETHAEQIRVKVKRCPH